MVVKVPSLVALATKCAGRFFLPPLWKVPPQPGQVLASGSRLDDIDDQQLPPGPLCSFTATALSDGLIKGHSMVRLRFLTTLGVSREKHS